MENHPITEPSPDFFPLNDIHNSEFQVIERYDEQLSESYYTYYTHVTDFDKGYHVDVVTEDGSVHSFDLN